MNHAVTIIFSKLVRLISGTQHTVKDVRCASDPQNDKTLEF